ncbi:aldo/keto reductase [Fructobacillus sp. M1-13]|uniref:Aldo/keto reductase n=1 Tax=Fructobacillus papyriferae TaxID=2713171 RepID=A0ABS5QNJ3_9LACO|nr:aldo/keto reductase [Fructobacillus papyriferae]MBS9334688.1 aldo/keto reductase [Fructobacillus papyriferae]MCD2158678.1 aldo/keto reductase [Fructobacillus papyriferae]
MLKETYTLSNGVEIPKIAFGTWLLDNQSVIGAVKNAINIGYRHIDTAAAYENEEGVGQAIRESNVARSDLFVTTKIVAEAKDYESAKAAIELSLNKLDIDYIDLLLIHSPRPWADYKSEHRYAEGNLQAWRAMEEAYEAGKIKSIGVANFERDDLENLIVNANISPMVDQVLSHIGHTPMALIEYAKKQNILIEAHSPFGHGDLMRNNEIKRMASELNVSVPQLAVNYLLQLGLVPLPKASSIEHMRNNASVDFTIPAEMMKQLENFSEIQYSEATSVFPVYQ